MSASQPDADAQPDPRHTGRSIPDVFREAFDHDYSALESSARVGDEFNQITDRFAFGEMWPASELDDRRKILVSVACVAASGGDELSALLRAGLHLGVAAKELQEVFHQIAPYVGISRTRHGLQELDKLVDAPIGIQSTVTEDDRLAKGIAAQKAMFGDGIDAMRENAPEDEGFIQDALSAYSNDAFVEYFVEQSLLQPIAQLDAAKLGIANVTIEPGCRNNWHIHHARRGGGQILMCTAGEGWYQEEGKPAVSMTEGSTVVIPPNVKHWHGAKADSWFSHIAISVPGEETSNEWLEPVSDEEYQSLTS